jgi:hypothetical protein
MSNATTKAVLLPGPAARISDLVARLTGDQLYDDGSRAAGKATTPDSPMATDRSCSAAPIRAGSWAPDPHKSSHTAVAIGAAEEPAGELRVRTSAAQAERLLAWAAAWPERFSSRPPISG